MKFKTNRKLLSPSKPISQYLTRGQDTEVDIFSFLQEDSFSPNDSWYQFLLQDEVTADELRKLTTLPYSTRINQDKSGVTFYLSTGRKSDGCDRGEPFEQDVLNKLGFGCDILIDVSTKPLVSHINRYDICRFGFTNGVPRAIVHKEGITTYNPPKGAGAIRGEIAYRMFGNFIKNHGFWPLDCDIPEHVKVRYEGVYDKLDSKTHTRFEIEFARHTKMNIVTTRWDGNIETIIGKLLGR